MIRSERWPLVWLGVLVLVVGGCRRSVVEPVRITVEPSSVRGVADESGRVHARYQIKNQGAVDLHLAVLSTSCGCTGATVESKTVSPGSSGWVAVEGDPPVMGSLSDHLGDPDTSLGTGTLR